MPCRRWLCSYSSGLPAPQAERGGGVQDRPVPLDVFVGRVVELALVAEVLTRVEAGQPWLVTIEGDPGIGKTALVRRCLAQASGVKVLSARGDQAETDLDLGIVDQLLRNAGDTVPTVPSAGGTGPAGRRCPSPDRSRPGRREPTVPSPR